MTFQELGETLQREREARGLTVKAVMDATKISRVVILALESGDRSALPHPVYIKGFIKSYARLLELDPDELCMVVDREYQLEPPSAGDLSYDVEPNAEKAFQDNDAPSGRRRRAIWPTILILLSLAGAAGILMLNLNKTKTPDVPVPATEPAGEAVKPAAPDGVAPEGASPGVAPADEQGGPAVEPESNSGQDTTGEAGESPAAEAAAAPAESASASVGADSASNASSGGQMASARGSAGTEVPDEDAAITQESAPAEPRYEHVLIIRATTDKGCWIGVWRGEESRMNRDFVLRKGEPLRLMFNSPRRIRIGNVAGVTVSYNGQPYSLDSSKGNIQTITFGM